MSDRSPNPGDVERIKSEVSRLFKMIKAPQRLFPVFNEWKEGYHVEIENGAYSFVLVERGEMIRRMFAVDLNDLLYLIFTQVTWEMAYSESLRQVDSTVDRRAFYFPKQIYLLSHLSGVWASRRQQEIEQILARHPYRR
jgi:hypothetical protein